MISQQIGNLERKLLEILYQVIQLGTNQTTISMSISFPLIVTESKLARNLFAFTPNDKLVGVLLS